MRTMSPRDYNPNRDEASEAEVQISHDEKETPPITAPPLPIAQQPTQDPVYRPMPPQADFSAQRPTAPPPVRTEEFYGEEEREPRRWLAIVLYAILALIVAAAVVFAGRWIYDKLTNDKPVPTPPPSGGQGQTPPPPANGQVPTPTPTPTPAPRSGSTSLPNNGPGDVLALFVGVTIAVAGLHYIYSLRRQN